MLSLKEKRLLAIAPLAEEILLRWGFYDFDCDGESLSVTEEHIAELKLYGAPLSLKAMATRLPGAELKADLTLGGVAADYEEYDRWRRNLRGLMALLTDENPTRMGRRSLYRWPQPRTVHGAFSEELPRSQEFLRRSYRDDFLVKEKKELVVDYRACHGNYLASIDRDAHGPLCILLDVSSQIASHIAGFNGFALHGVLRHPESFLNPDYRYREIPAARALGDWLLRHAPPGLEHVCFCNSGTESWEKAVYLAQVKCQTEAKKLLCFRGSFHGRTLLSLFSSWNPVKREPFQLKGFETLWADFPEDKEPHLPKPTPPGWLECWENAAEISFEPPRFQDDPLMAAEVDSLLQVREQLMTGEILAVSVEPLQCEGGDRYATNRWFQGLRLLTRAFGVSLIFDEVQSGFGLGGPVFWCSLFGLQDSAGNPLGPDFINLAKKCQVGAVLSCIPDPAPCSAHAPSFARGYYNALMVREKELETLGNDVAERLCALAGRFKMLENPRGRALAFAFDLPTPELAQAFVAHRFYRGFMVYIAGKRTLRFRLQLATRLEDVDFCFEMIAQTLEHLVEHGHEVMPEKADHPWEDAPKPHLLLPDDMDNLLGVDWDGILRRFGQLEDGRYRQLQEAVGEQDPVSWFQERNSQGQVTFLEMLRLLAIRHAPRLVPLTPENWEQHRAAIMALEERTYEPARRDTEEFLKGVVHCPRQISCLALAPDGRLAGFAMSAPLEHFPQVKGPDADPSRGANKVLYSADIAVDSAFRGRGLGYRLKRYQYDKAREAGFDAIRSRNREDATAGMMLINKTFGAYEFGRYQEDYGGAATAVYWSKPVSQERSYPLLLSHGVEELTGGELDPKAWEDWDLAALNKNSLCNWWTPNMCRHVEWLRSVSPLGHLYLASGRDETLDKAIKCLIHARIGSDTCLSFQGAYWGHTTAAARSLSDARYLDYFPWLHLPYPSVSGDPFADVEAPLTEKEEYVLKLLREHLAKADRFLGVFIEPVQEMTGRRCSVRFLRALRRECDRYHVPLVFNESASWAYRGSERLFFTQAAEVRPDLLLFFAGGQVGHLLVNDAYFLSKPLQLISTWDGDELSCLRLRAQLRYLESKLDEDALAAFDSSLAPYGNVYRATGRIRFPSQTTSLQIRRALGSDLDYLVMPPLNRVAEAQQQLMKELSP